MSIFKIIHNFSDFFLHILDFIFPKNEKQSILESLTLSDWKSISKLGIHENIYFFFPYENKNVRDAIWEIKYKRNKQLKEKLVTIVCEHMLPEISEKMTFENFENPVVTFVPQSKKRKNERGYNQSKDLAEDFAKKMDFDTSEFLKKIRETENQTKLNRTKRLSNMKNSFGVISVNNISDKNIILIDDVTTTGATLNEVRKVLIETGAKKVICIALAH